MPPKIESVLEIAWRSGQLWRVIDVSWAEAGHRGCRVQLGLLRGMSGTC